MMLSISVTVGNRYLAIYVASYVGRKSVTSFVINLLNNKTIILLNLVEYRLILADEAYSSAKYQTISRAISQDNC